MIDLAALAILVLRGWHGWKKGTLLMVISLAGLFAGYVGAVFLFRPVGGYLVRTFDMSPMLAFPLAAMVIMGCITGGLRLARAAEERRRGMVVQQGQTHSPLDSAGGAAMGAVWAAGLVLVVAWAVMGLHGALRIGPDISKTVTGRVTSAVTSRVARAIARRKTGNQLVASMVALVAGQPGTGVAVVNTLMNNQRVRGLWSDSTVRRALARGDVQSLQASPLMRALVRDTQFVHAAAQLGLGSVGLNGVAGSDQLVTNLVTQAGPIVRSFQSLGDDPAARRLLNSPELKRALERGDVGALLGNAEFRELGSRLMEILRSPQGALPAGR